MESYLHSEKIGKEVRFNHEECGDTRSRLYVKRTAKGFIYHCHNCSSNGFVHSKYVSSPTETLSRLEKPKEYQEVSDTKLYLPEDFTPDITDRGKAWLYKYGITDDDAKLFRFGTYQSGNRLLLGVFNNGSNLIYYQGRSLDGSKPKYLNVRAKGAKDVYFRTGSGNVLCIVEDILSAIKVGRVTSSLALLGSYAPIGLTKIVNEYHRVCFWLDPDKLKDSIRYSQEFQVRTGVPCRSIISDKDPKEYNEDDINRMLLDAVL